MDWSNIIGALAMVYGFLLIVLVATHRIRRRNNG